WAFALSDIDKFAIYLAFSALALVQVVWHHRLIRTRDRDGCFRAFRANHWLGLTLFAGVAAAFALAG
ncbi:MAG: 4-hydroxybenzoate octaprenyltransferase, partial [Burkholderiaceae bacterium]|nr:4-hydroxybenzoate octaprenyltransferase [Burkholderiaceae bacterium]